MLVVLVCLGLILPAAAQDRPAGVHPGEIDPNTKIEGGADVRGSAAAAGASARPDKRNDEAKREELAEPAKRDLYQDRPISERKPQEREEATRARK